MNLYSRSAKLAEIEEYLIESEGEVDEAIYDELVIRQEKFTTTMLEYLQNIRILNSEIEFANSEIARIQKINAPKLNLIERLKKEIKDAVIKWGEKDPKKDLWRFKAETFSVNTITKPSVDIFDFEALNDKFKRVAVQELSMEEYIKLADELGRDLKTSIDALKTPIKKAIEDGEEVEGATIVNNISIQIR